ncbi:MAG: PP2C family protein-serine/threonine phosphatase [Nocardioidaceae bacterium]
MALSLRFSAISDIGRRRKNDDSGYAGPHLVMVADGMGGAPHGDLASSVAIQTMQRLDHDVPDDMLEALAGAVHRANDRLAELIEEDAATEGMGTTVTAALFDGSRIGVVHLGDSRGYLWRNGELLRISKDHSWVQSLIDEGRISEEEAAVHSHRSLLLKVLDGRHDNDPDLTVYDVEAGDRLLLCSDGLSGFVDHERLERVLSIGTAEAVAAELIQLALESNSNDNITVVVADVVDEPPTDAGPIVVGAAAEHPRGSRGRLRSWTHRHSGPGETVLEPDDDPETLRYAPREPPRLRRLRGLLVLVVLAVLFAVLASAGYGWTQKQYYVAAYEGRVTIYRGVQANLPGVTLHSVYETPDLSLDELPTFRRSEVLDGLAADDLDDARKIVGALKSMARACATQTSKAPRPTSSASTNTTPRAESQSGGQIGTRSTTRDQAPSRSSSPSRTTSTRSEDATKSSTTRSETSDTTSPTIGGTSSDGGPSVAECAGATPAEATS